MAGADVAQSELGYTGKSIKVAVMDTGIDYDHPDLGGCFGRAAVLSWVGTLSVMTIMPMILLPAITVPSPILSDDCNGHGTHVAGIIGASGAVTGVAPEVTLARTVSLVVKAPLLMMLCWLPWSAPTRIKCRCSI